MTQQLSENTEHTTGMINGNDEGKHYYPDKQKKTQSDY